MYYVHQRKCSICRELFEPRKDYETMCYGCYHKNRVQNHKEEKSKLQLKITYLQDQITQLLSELKRVGDVNESISGKFPEELIDPKILKDALFLCHPDRNGDIERSRDVTMWLNQLRDWINGK